MWMIHPWSINAQAAAMVANAKGSLSLADAYLKSDAAALQAEATRKASTDATKKGIERHHLFPRNYLKNIGVTKVRAINQIANMALVEWADNIEISDEAPSDYWPRELEKKNFSKETIEQQMYWHALPKDWHIMEYDEFLQQRRQLMARIVKTAFDELS